MNSDREKKLIQKLRKRPYRRAYVGENVRRGIAHQIRALREDPGRLWNQGGLSKKLGKPQSVVSRMEDPSYGKLTVQTLLEVAAVFDVALSIRFIDFPAFIAQTRDLTEASLRVESFDQSELSAAVQEISDVSGSVLNASPSPKQFDFNRPPKNTLLAQIEEFSLQAGVTVEPAPIEQTEENDADQQLLAAAVIASKARGRFGRRSNRQWN